MRRIYEFFTGEAFGEKEPHIQCNRCFPFTVFVYVCEGVYYCTAQGTELAVGKGETLVVPPYVYHNIEMKKHGSLHWAHISLTVDDNIFSSGQTAPYIIKGVASQKLGWCLKNLNNISETTDEMRCSLLHDRYISEIFDTVLSVRTHFSEPKELEYICDMIRRSPGEKYTLSMLSELSNMSQRNFEQKFKAEYNKSPMQYVSECRIMSAIFLLLNGKSVKEIAQQMGYYDTYHFSKQFKKALGVSPSEYAKTHSLEA